MDKKVILIVVDGLRPDALDACGHEFVYTLKNESLYTANAKSVMPSVTLPCHMSMFHGVPAERHGVTTNVYTPQVRPVNGLCEVLKAAGKTSAFFYTWNELRDLARPGSLTYSSYINLKDDENSDWSITEECLEKLSLINPDFVFLYLGKTDLAGHYHGWMGKEYMETVYKAVDCIQTVYEYLGDEYDIIVTADHGGHDRMHGTDMKEDMLVPVAVLGRGIGELPADACISDIAPTVCKMLGVKPDPEWEGKSIL